MEGGGGAKRGTITIDFVQCAIYKQMNVCQLSLLFVLFEFIVGLEQISNNSCS